MHSNGYITLSTTNSVRRYGPRPSSLSSLRRDPMIAAYWADADLRCGPSTGKVWYRETTDAEDLNAAAGYVTCRYGNNYHPTSAVVITCKDVGYYNCHGHSSKVYSARASCGYSIVQKYVSNVFTAFDGHLIYPQYHLQMLRVHTIPGRDFSLSPR